MNRWSDIAKAKFLEPPPEPIKIDPNAWKEIESSIASGTDEYMVEAEIGKNDSINLMITSGISVMDYLLKVRDSNEIYRGYAQATLKHFLAASGVEIIPHMPIQDILTGISGKYVLEFNAKGYIVDKSIQRIK
jgi:hypothetical protein